MALNQTKIEVSYPSMNKSTKWHSIDTATVFEALGSGPHGLTMDDAKARLEKYGRNELEKEKRASPLVLLLNQFKNILIIILLFATVLSVAIGETVDAAIIAVIVVFSALLGFTQEYRAEQALEALKKMLHATTTVLRDGKEAEVDSKDVVPGDVLMLDAGDKVPADARVIESASLRCDEAPLTGESMPVDKSTGPLPADTVVADRDNMVFTGSVITYGRAKAAVTSTGMETEFGKIAKEVSAVRAEKTPLEIRTHEIGKWLGVVSLGICVFVIGVSAARELMGGTFNMESGVSMLMFGVALAVAAVPEALAAIVTGALAIGMHEMAKRNALVRKMPAVETLGCTTVICTDKTGTLTRGEMTVRRIFAAERYVEISGAGYEPEGELSGSEGIEQELDMLLRAGVLCNDSHLFKDNEKWAIRGDPTEAALVVAAAKSGIETHQLRQDSPRLSEVPFSSERKLMTTVHPAPEGRVAYVKGAPEVVLQRATRIQGPQGPRAIEEKDKEAILRANEDMANGALRVIALAYRPLDGDGTDADYIENDLVFLGLSGMMDPPRPEATEAVETCRRVSMRPIMITGDHKLTAMAVAREMGIYREGDMALTGEELEAMGDVDYEAIVDKVSVYARVSPTDKLKIVRAWKNRGEVVAMTGDGVNDAPALKHADIGIAMGITGTEVAKEAADMVLSDDNFATIVSAVERGRWIYDNIKKYLTFLLRCNITEVLVIGGVVLALGPEFLPLLPAAILYVNLATDGLPALALGVAPPDPDIMKRPPRDPSESVFSREVLTFIIMAVIIETPIFLFMYFGSLPDMELSRTRMFFLFIIVELVIAMNFRSMRYSILSAPPHKWLLIAIFWEVVLIVGLMQVPAVRDAFGIAMPSTGDLVSIAGIGLLVLIAMEALKYVLRASRRRRGIQV
jgi:Ca2+-transporting ATPase